MEKEFYSHFRGATLEEVIRVEINEGKGTEEDPIKRVTYWVDKNGEVIGHTDDIKDRNFRGKD